MLNLAFGLRFEDIYSVEGASEIDRRFVAHLSAADAALAERFATARAAPDTLSSKEEASLLIDVAPHVEDFLAELFDIESDVRALEARHHEWAPVFAVRRQFVQRKAMNAHKADVAAAFDGHELRAQLDALLDHPQGLQAFELALANAVTRWQTDEAANAQALDVAQRYAAWAAHTSDGKRAHKGGVLFRSPRKLDVLKLVPVQATQVNGVEALKLAEDHPLRRREGFALTDAGTSFEGGLSEAHYCIWCHEQGKDSCAHGLMEKKPAGGAPLDNPFKKSAFGVTLAGCPLDERISEFHKLRADGWPIGALAMICIDNPMVAATGHRICNDCMKSCIYQKQEPVNIPQIETRTLKDVLDLPWGFEIYSLLTRWNPLNFRRPLPRAPTGYKVLIAGMGPAGFTLAHYLMNEGHAVAGIDGLKIEPLPARFSGIDADGSRSPFEPIRDVQALYESLDDRVMSGF